MHFNFIFFLALGAIVDFHVELRYPNMEVKSHEEALMEVVVLCKLRPTTLGTAHRRHHTRPPLHREFLPQSVHEEQLPAVLAHP
jgi:hypothetical protein